MSEAERLAKMLDEALGVDLLQTDLVSRTSAELRRLSDELEALKKAMGEPVGFMSEMQIPLVIDPEDDSGHYIPMRKTKKGNFQLALYALTKDQS